MNKLALCALALSACISDLSVGLSVAEISDEDSGSPVQEHDAGSIDATTRDAELVDAFVADANVVDAQFVDAAAHDAGPAYIECAFSECVAGFTGMTGKEPPQERCDDGRLRICARLERDQACEYLCVD